MWAMIKEKLSEQVTVRITKSTMEALVKIQKRHGYDPVDVARLCLDTVAEHFTAKKHFAFPISIQDAFDVGIPESEGAKK